MSTSDFGPGHRALPRIFANPKESQLAEITQLLFQSGSQTILVCSARLRAACPAAGKRQSPTSWCHGPVPGFLKENFVRYYFVICDCD
jgi:hypothetical protein